MSQTGQAVENALKGEKTFQSISYALTGDPELDLIAGLIAVINQPGAINSGNHFAMCERALVYLATRYKFYREQAQEWEKKMASVQGLGGSYSSGQIQTQPPPNIWGQGGLAAAQSASGPQQSGIQAIPTQSDLAQALQQLGNYEDRPDKHPRTSR